MGTGEVTSRVVVGEWSPQVTPPHTTPGTWQRFTRKAVMTPDCWYWVGAIADDGYGRFHSDEQQTVRVSRYVLQACTGPLGPGMVAEHRERDEPSCTRLSHLRASTQAENLETARRRDRHNVSPWRPGRADRRGMAGRSRDIREALQDTTAGGYRYQPERLEAALLARVGDPGQRELFTVRT